MDENLVIRFNNLKSWSAYARYIRGIVAELQEPIFRGQGNKLRSAGVPDSGWELEPSLYRLPVISHPQFIQWVKTILTDLECHSILTETIGRPLTGKDDRDRLLIIGLMRHLGLRTPLLDWTKKAFVAAYFAFHSIHKTAKAVSIFLFDQKAWLENKGPLTSRDLDIVTLMELEHVIPRQKAQESIYTYSRSRNVYSELLGDEFEGGEYFIAICSLPSDDREKALEELSEMGISADNLFPDLERVDELKRKLETLIKDLCSENLTT